jgi:sugar lactone lactonase YvrE
MYKPRVLLGVVALCGWPCVSHSADFRLLSLDRAGTLTWANALVPGVCTVETAPSAAGPWQPVKNTYATNPFGFLTVPPTGRSAFYRVLSLDISATPAGYSNLCASYSTLRTIAGKGEISEDGFNAWEGRFEGGPATEVELSRPHMAMADDAGNVFIADKDSHAIRKVTPAGRIFTVAGMNEPGDDGDAPGPATQRHLAAPNGLWVRGDGTLYILDTDNDKVRKVDTNGVLSTLFEVKGGIEKGRGLWVSDNETVAYVAAGNAVKRWTPGGGVKTFEDGFNELGNLTVDFTERVVVTDRAENRVYRLSNDGKKTVIAGNGDTSGGGDGALAKETALHGVRGVWFLPNSGYFLATHEGSQIWYVDTRGIIHLFLDGARNAHAGDGEDFKTLGLKISEVRAITMDKQGNILITENDAGFIRRIDFLRQGAQN